MLSASLLSLLALGLGAAADQAIYSSGALAAGWENWSWSSTIDFASTDGPGGEPSISVASQAYAALSLYDESVFGGNFAGIKFDVSGAKPDVSLYLNANADNGQSVSIPFSAMNAFISSSNWTTLVLDFHNLPPSGSVLPTDTWDRINFQAGGNGATYFIKNIQLLTEIVVTPKFLSAEPLVGNVIAVTTQGAVDFSQVSVTLNGTSIPVSSKTTFSPPDTPSQTITYLTLAKQLAPGPLNITAGNATFAYTIPAPKYGTINISKTKAISPLIYGANFPTDANFISELGITVSRWGGNAVTAYNPFGQFTNAGNDWYFENRVADPPDADAWIGMVSGAGSKSLLTIPALDWVSKDATSYSYPKSVYPSQTGFDPYNSDAGSGLFPNGSYVTPVPSQWNVYSPWNLTLAKQWLAGLTHKPDIVTVDNEIEIASNTHQDMHPAPMGFDEELARVVNTSIMAKSALPNVEVAAPSTCAWWYYWTSSIGYSDNAAHGNMDFLPWFLQEMKKAETTAGQRLLDYLDIHYYYGADTSAGDAAALATRMRMTRSLWDPSYVDESYIGTSVPTQWSEPNPNAVWLIPRMQQLIAQFYPGTKLSISEWSPTNDGDVTGGLVAVDQLGIYGREGVDSATYWGTSDTTETGPVGLAFWLFRGNGTTFGSNSVQANMADNDADTLGVYASTSDGKKVSLVLVNKDTAPVNLEISNIPAGTYFLRHFGGKAGVAKWQTQVQIAAFPSSIVIPAYTAVFLQQQ